MEPDVFWFFSRWFGVHRILKIMVVGQGSDCSNMLEEDRPQIVISIVTYGNNCIMLCKHFPIPIRQIICAHDQYCLNSASSSYDTDHNVLDQTKHLVNGT